MFNTDEMENQVDTLRFMIYYLVYKMGGKAEINFKEMNELFNNPGVHRFVMDTENGLAFKVEQDIVLDF
jgi:hypothetical protein